MFFPDQALPGAVQPDLRETMTNARENLLLQVPYMGELLFSQLRRRHVHRSEDPLFGFGRRLCRRFHKQTSSISC